MLNNVVIVSAKRTPIGNFRGKLSSLSAVEIGSITLKKAIESVNLDPDLIDELIILFHSILLPSSSATLLFFRAQPSVDFQGGSRGEGQECHTTGSSDAYNAASARLSLTRRPILGEGLSLSLSLFSLSLSLSVQRFFL